VQQVLAELFGKYTIDILQPSGKLPLAIGNPLKKAHM
jgi:hypothetical protein